MRPVSAGRLWGELRSLLREAGEVSLKLYRIMIPILIGVKIVQELGGIAYLAMPLKPLMALVGLPPEMGLVWATALINNIYGGIIVFLTLPESQALTSAQATVLCTMILVAHSLPVEVRIAQESGTRFIFQALIRIVGALALGALLHGVYSGFGLLQQENVIFWQGEVTAQASLLQWGLDQVRNLALIFGIILGLILVMRLLDCIRATDFFVWLLGPLLRALGIGREAAPLTIIGMIMGLTYGGGLIIKESRSGRVSSRDVFASLTLMGLAHSMIEDTLLMMVLGGHLSGILWARVLFALAVVSLLVHSLSRLPERWIHRFLYATPGRA
jgi:hypothetical protein